MQIQFSDLEDFTKEMRRVDPRLNKELQKAHKQISVEVSAKAARRVAGLHGPRSGMAAAGVRPRAGQKHAAVALLGSNKYVRAAVMGANIHWVFGRPIPASSMRRRVWPQWIGDDWTPESGLYGVSPAIAEAIPNIVDTYGDRILAALSNAFPD